jgi:glucan 1,3-beta-glucosidase
MFRLAIICFVWQLYADYFIAGGTDYKASKAGTTTASTFYSQAVCGLVAWGYNAFYFEAFDEPWKPNAVGDNGIAADETHWGAMTADRKNKFSLKC